VLRTTGFGKFVGELNGAPRGTRYAHPLRSTAAAARQERPRLPYGDMSSSGTTVLPSSTYMLPIGVPKDMTGRSKTPRMKVR